MADPIFEKLFADGFYRDSDKTRNPTGEVVTVQNMHSIDLVGAVNQFPWDWSLDGVKFAEVPKTKNGEPPEGLKVAVAEPARIIPLA